jgi:hypothetical protein
MTVKTLTGPSIQDALSQAREEFGDDVVLMESTPATEDAPAEIAIAVDPPVADTANAGASRGSVPKPSGDKGSMAVPDTGSEDEGTAPGLGGGGMHPTGSGDGDSGVSGGATGPHGESSNDDLPTSQDFGEVLEREQGPGRGQIFSNSEGEGRDRGAGTDRADQSRDR